MDLVSLLLGKVSKLGLGNPMAELFLPARTERPQGLFSLWGVTVRWDLTGPRCWCTSPSRFSNIKQCPHTKTLVTPPAGVRSVRGQ